MICESADLTKKKILKVTLNRMATSLKIKIILLLSEHVSKKSTKNIRHKTQVIIFSLIEDVKKIV